MGGSAGAAGGAGGAAGMSGAGSGGAGGSGAGGSAGTPAMPERGPLFPANGATSVCRDATLRLRFEGKPTVASTGKISVFEVGGASTPVAVVDLAVAMIDETVGANQLRVTLPVYVGDDEVIVRLPKNALAYGKRYYVTVPAGAIRGPDGAASMFTDEDDWQFSTHAAAPSDLTRCASRSTALATSARVQGALDALPAQTSRRRSRSAPAPTTRSSTSRQEQRHAARRRPQGDRHLGANNNNLNPAPEARAGRRRQRRRRRRSRTSPSTTSRRRAARRPRRFACRTATSASCATPTS